MVDLVLRMLLKRLILLSILASLSLGAIKKSSSINDLSMRQYTEEGEIAQIKYANEAVVRAMPVIGWIEPSLNASIIISCSHPTSPLCLSGSHDSSSDLFHEEKTVIVSTGIRTDCRQLLQKTNNIILSNRLTFSNPPTIEKLCHNLAIWLTKGMYPRNEDDDNDDDSPSTRPYATAALISQFDMVAKKAKLFQLQNSGSFQECSFSCLGRLSKETLKQVRQSALSVTVTTNEIPSSSTEKLQYSVSLFSKLNRIIRALALDLYGTDGIDNDVTFEVCMLRHDRIYRAKLSSRQLLGQIIDVK